MAEFKDSLKSFGLLLGFVLLMAWPFLGLALTLSNS